MDILLKFFFWLILVAILLFELANIRYYLRPPKGTKNIRFTAETKKLAVIRNTKINSRKLYTIVSRENTETSPTILYIHGGAYVGGISKIHWNFINHLLKDTKAKIIFPDYPLATKKKNTYRDVFDMILKIYEQISDNTDFIVLGDSAGGGISLALMQLMSKENKKLPEKLILVSPWLDITLKNEKIDEVQKEDKVLNKQVLKLASDMYCGKDDPNNFMTSPINGEIDNLPPITIFTGTSDILNPDVHVFNNKFEDKSKIKIYETEKAAHNWIIDDINGNNEDYKKLIHEILN